MPAVASEAAEASGAAEATEDAEASEAAEATEDAEASGAAEVSGIAETSGVLPLRISNHRTSRDYAFLDGTTPWHSITAKQNTTSSSRLGRCTLAFWLAVSLDLVGLAVLLTGVFSEVFFYDLLLYAGSIMIFFSLFWWIFWYTGNVEAPPDYSFQSSKRGFRLRSSSILQAFRNSMGRSLTFYKHRRNTITTQNRPPLPLVLKMGDSSQPVNPQLESPSSASLPPESFQPEDPDLQPEHFQSESSRNRSSHHLISGQKRHIKVTQPVFLKMVDTSQSENRNPQPESSQTENSKLESSQRINQKSVVISKEYSFKDLEGHPTEKPQESETVHL